MMLDCCGPDVRQQLAGAVLVLALGGIGTAGCSSGPAETAKLPDAATVPVTVAEGQRVTGTAPTSRDGSLTVVMLEPDSAGPVEPPTEPVQMDQLGMEFLPPVLLATVGQPVHFHNGEDILHNVRVYNIDTKETAFNISTPIGGTYEHIFDIAGTYRVACDIHPQMGASVVVTATPYATVADREGHFTLHDVPPGPYTAVVHAGSNRSRQRVTIEARATALTLGGS